MDTHALLRDFVMAGLALNEATIELEAAVALAEKKSQLYEQAQKRYAELKSCVTNGSQPFYLDIGQRVIAVKERCETDKQRRPAVAYVIEGINETDEVTLRVRDEKDLLDVVIVIKPDHEPIKHMILGFFGNWDRSDPCPAGCIAEYKWPRSGTKDVNPFDKYCSALK
jgi:hypothetical protein